MQPCGYLQKNAEQAVEWLLFAEAYDLSRLAARAEEFLADSCSHLKEIPNAPQLSSNCLLHILDIRQTNFLLKAVF